MTRIVFGDISGAADGSVTVSEDLDTVQSALSNNEWVRFSNDDDPVVINAAQVWYIQEAVAPSFTGL
jgi:hypothetical protein